MKLIGLSLGNIIPIFLVSLCKVRSTLCAAVFVLCVSVSAFAATLTVSTDRTSLYAGESFILTLRIDGTADDISDIHFDTTEEAAYENLGSQVSSQSYVQIINGQTTRQDNIVRMVTFRISPKADGEFQIRTVSLRVGSQTLSAQGPALRITGVEEQDILKLSVIASQETLLVEEPFDITLRLKVRQLLEPNAAVDPFPYTPPPQLTIPYLGADLPVGLSGKNAKDILQPLLADTRAFGFTINDFTIARDAFSFFGFDPIAAPTPARFTLKREASTWSDGSPAWLYHLTLGFLPQLEGTYTFGPVTFKGQSITNVLSGGTPEFRDIFAVGPAVTVRVVPPPEKDRPSSFIGAVGASLLAEAKLDTQTCKQGDPLLLTLTLTGRFSQSNVRPPTLSDVPGLNALFRVYDTAVRTETLPEGGRRYTYTVRPLTSGTQEFPPIPISYFNTLTRTYRTVRTLPLPLRVDAVEHFDPSRLIDAAPDSTMATSIRIRNEHTLPAAITVTLMPPPPPVVMNRLALMVSLTVLPVLTFVAWFSRKLLLRYPHYRNRRRRASAVGRAEHALRKAKSNAETLTAVSRFFEEYFDLPMASFSPSDVRDVLTSVSMDTTIIRDLIAILQPLYDAQYNHREMSVDVDTEKLILLLERLTTNHTNQHEGDFYG